MTKKILGFAVFVFLAITLLSSIFLPSSSFLLGDTKAYAQQAPIKLELNVWATTFLHS
jgi:hypothetical protein